MPTIPTPPVDNSGGFFVLKYSNGARTHTARLHVQPFGANLPGAGPTDDTFNPTDPGTTVDVHTEAANYMAFLQPFLSTAWSIAHYETWQVVGGVATLYPAAPLAGTVLGTNATAEAVAQEAEEVIFNFRTNRGNRARLVILESSVAGIGIASQVAANSAGDLFQKMVAYTTGTATRICGHDGGLFLPPARVTYTLNRRLRRHLGWQ